MSPALMYLKSKFSRNKQTKKDKIIKEMSEICLDVDEEVSQLLTMIDGFHERQDQLLEELSEIKNVLKCLEGDISRIKNIQTMLKEQNR